VRGSGIGNGGDEVAAVRSADFRQLVPQPSNFLPTDPECAHIPFMEVLHAVRRVWLRHVGMRDEVTDF